MKNNKIKTNQNVYCRLEIYCELNIITDRQHKSNIEKSLRDNETEVFVETYDDFLAVKNRILELNHMWLDKYPEEKVYWSDNINKNNNLISSGSPRFLIYNRWKKAMPIGLTYKGWYASYIFSNYSTKYVKDKYGKDKFDEVVWREKFGFMAPDHMEVNELYLMSEKTTELFVTEWLEKETVSEEFMEKIFQEELENRNFF